MEKLLALKALGNFPLSTSSILPLLREYKRPYDKINYWVKSGDLIQVKKGLYVLGNRFSEKSPDPFLLANQIYGPSYISMDSALSLHGLIPERVFQITSVSTRTSKQFNTAMGRFDYIQVKPSYFSFGIGNYGNPTSGYFMMASPEKALWDKIVLTSGVLFRSKVDVMQFLEEDLRIDLTVVSNWNPEQMANWVPFSPKKSSLQLFIKTLKEL
jgi:hypothetical protein